jgi:hypothetical protein
LKEKEMIKYKKARELSIRKWTWIVKNWDYSKSFRVNLDSLFSNIPEIKLLKGCCGFCDYHGSYSKCCIDCIDSYKNWRYSTPEKDGTFYAEKILKMCINSSKFVRRKK